jgi:creatinine amidohydrolase/Fe(II)-dependent formamide hydrolase-like protein
MLKKILYGAAVLSTVAGIAGAQGVTQAGVNPAQLSKHPPKGPLVEFEKMTWPEVKQALAQGKTTALIYTGGTEQRGPQNANGGHTLMATYTAKAIALKLGNAIVMPVLPYTPNNASATLPGTIGLTPELLTAVLERIVEQTFATGFTNVVIMGDHGGGQGVTGYNSYKAVVDSLEPIYAKQGKHVFYCDEVYHKAQDDFDKWLAENGYPVSSHAGIPDTSTMLMLDSSNVWVRRDLIPTALGDTMPRGRRGGAANAAPRVNNGISGDGRRSSVELGRRAFNIKVEYAVRQINEFLASTKGN